MGYIIPDTNMLLHDPEIISHLIEKLHVVVIPLTVLDELDRIKGRDGDLGFKARQAIRIIDKLKENTQVILTAEYIENPLISFKKGDRCIQSTALAFKKKGIDIVILTADTAMRLSAQALGINSVKNIGDLAQVDKNRKILHKKDMKIENINKTPMDFGTVGIELFQRIKNILGPEFKPKYNNTGITFYGHKGRILKLVYSKTKLYIEFNVPVSRVDGLIILTDKERREKKMGTCQWIYKGDSLTTVLKLVEEALVKY